jgi:hypothetical protein
MADQPPPEQRPALASSARITDAEASRSRTSGWLKSIGVTLGASLRDAVRVPKARVDEQAELERRIAARQSLDDVGDVGAEAASTARFVLAEVKDAVQRTREASRTVESKATSIVTLAVATIGFAAAFRQGQMFTSPVIVVILVLFLLTVTVATSVALPGGTYTPDPLAYNISSTLTSEGAEARIAMKLAEEWGRVAGETAQLLRTRTLRLKIAFALLYGTVATTLALVIYFVFYVPPPR